MSIADKITSITGHLEDDYTALEQLGVSVEDRNIENIKDMANQIYAKFPKTAYAEGSNITLSNTLKGKLDYENNIVGYGDTQQDSATGSNLMNTEKLVNGTYNGLTITKDSDDFINISGTATANTSIVLSEITYNFPSELYISYENNFTTSTAQLTFLNGSTTLGGLTFSAANRTYDMSTILGGKTCTRIELYITSGNTINGKFRPMLNTQSGQPYSKYTFPNPSYPQDIEVVRGKNVLGFANSSSKTRLGLTFTWSNSSITVNGTSTNTETVFGDGVNLKPVKVEGTYKVSGYTRSDTFFQLYWKDKNGTIKYKELKNNPTITFNEGDTLYQLFFFAAKNDILTYNNETFNLQLEKGTEVTSFLPYNTLEVKARGLNSFDYSVIDNNHISMSNPNNATISFNDNGFTITPTTQGDNYTISGMDVTNATIRSDLRKYLIEVKPNTAYTFIMDLNYSVLAGLSSYYSLIDSSYKVTAFGATSGHAKTIDSNNKRYYTNITTAADTKYLGFRYGNQGPQPFTYSNIMLVEGTYDADTLPTYEPYITPITKQLSLGDIELAKIGTYRDYIYKNNDKWYKKEYIGKTTLDNTKTYSYSSYFGAIIWADSSIKDMASNTEIGAISNKAIGISPLNLLSNNGIAQNNSNNRILVKFEGVSSYNTDTLAKQYFNSNPYEVYYVLATATDTEITDTTLKGQLEDIYNMQSVNGTTIIEIDGQLPMIIKVRALKGE